MATRPHLTEEMQAFLQKEFGTTNISGTANALLVIGLYAIGVQPPADESPRLLRRADLPMRLAEYLRAISENPAVPASPLLSPQVMSLMSQLLGSVQALTSVPWRIPNVQQDTQVKAIDQPVSNHLSQQAQEEDNETPTTQEPVDQNSPILDEQPQIQSLVEPQVVSPALIELEPAKPVAAPTSKRRTLGNTFQG